MTTIRSRQIKKSTRWIAGTLILTYASHLLFIPIVLAAPVGLSSTTPGISFSGVGTSNTTITSSSLRSIVNAQGFDTVRGETVNVIQSNNASMLIRIGGAPTSYDGILNAMGQLILLNPNGIIFGPNAQINVGALIASSLHLTDANFLAGQYLFQGTGIEGVVRNMGAINGTSGVYLLAPNVENHGVITSPGGNIVLTAGATAYLSNRPDGNGLLAELRAPSGQALNVGELRADGGNISMAGLVVNQNGLVQANAVQSRNGRIELIARQPDNATAADAAASVTLGASSVTRADGGAITATGQTVTHKGELQANGGAIEVTATAGAQAGSGSLTTETGSKMTADGGTIRLTGDKITHGGMMQANAVNGQPGSIDIRARGANASLATAAGSRIAANGGDVVLEGRVIDQGGTIQADAVGERNGHVTFFGGDQLMFRATSDISTKGTATTGEHDVRDGGTIVGMARNVGGTVTVDPVAKFDLSAAPGSGGKGGELWLGDRRQNLGLIGTGTVIGASQTRLIPIDSTVSYLSASGGPNDVGSQRDVSLVALNDLTITGFLDLSGRNGDGSLVLPQAADPSRLRLIAGRDVLFQDLMLLGPSPFNLPTRWDIVGLAERSILFTGFAGSLLHTANGGGINLQARIGDVNLVDPATGALSTVRVHGSGGLSIQTGQDLIAPTGFDPNGGMLGFNNVKGISIDGSGKLNLEVGRDFLGGQPDGVPSGPGFVLWNPDTTVTPQHRVTVQGKIGETNLTLGSDGLPLTVAQQLARMSEADIKARKPFEEEKTRGYADFALSGGELSITAGGNVYVSRIRDAGLVGGKDAVGNSRDPQFAAGLENTKVSIVSRQGNILINTDLLPAGRSGDVDKLGALLPASFEARAENGTIQIRSNLTFLPSPTGRIALIARDHVQGVPITSWKAADASFFDAVYVGFPGTGGHWVVYDKRTASQNSEIQSYLGKKPPNGADATKPVLDSTYTYPDYAYRPVDENIPHVKLLEVSPADLAGKSVSDATQLVAANIPTAAVPSSQGSVTFKTMLGDISKLSMDLISRPFKKDILIDAGRDILQLFARIFVPSLGVTKQTVIEHVALLNDAGQLRPITKNDADVDPSKITLVDVPVEVQVPIVAATVRAGRDIVLNKVGGDGGLEFTGTGAVRVMAKRNLDLADGSGLNFILTPSNERGGLLDISVGNNLEMTTSRIVSEAGAGISIHGYDETDKYLVGYDNSKLYPLQLPDALRMGINLPAVGGQINVGENTGAAQKVAGERPTGIYVIRGGSVGQAADTPIVQADGKVTAHVGNDPAAILIRAKGNVEVNQSRIGTFGGGDIRITSLQGIINAGSGSKNDLVSFPIDQPVLDGQGNPVLNPDGTLKTVKVSYTVPGSGIFTFHPADPKSIDPPKFSDPEINALLAEAGRQSVFGRNVSALNARANKLTDERKPIFNETIAKPFIQSLKLGDIQLAAERGDIVIPPAGIRGRTVDLYAPHGKVDFQGGAVSGNVNIFAGALGGSVSISGVSNFSGGATPPPLPPLSGTGAAAAASTTAAASSTSSKSADSVQESAAEQTSQQAEAKAKHASSKEAGEPGEKSKLAKSVRVKRGVVIQVDVKPQQGS